MLAPSYGTQSLILSESGEGFREKAGQLVGAHDLVLTAVERLGDQYVFVVSEGTGWSGLSTRTSWNLRTGSDAGVGEDGQYIISLVKTDPFWVTTLASGTGITDQRVTVLDSWEELQDHIESEWDDGFVITDMMNHEEQYHVVTSAGLGWGQLWILDPGYPKEELMRVNVEDGVVISEVMRVGNEYLWVCSSDTGHGRSHAEDQMPLQFLELAIRTLQTSEGFKGYRMSLIREVCGKPHLVFC